MGKLGPVSRDELVRRLRSMGFDGPFVRSKHPYMIRDRGRVTIPNVHRGGISVGLLTRILSQAGIGREEWLESE